MQDLRRHSLSGHKHLLLRGSCWSLGLLSIFLHLLHLLPPKKTFYGPVQEEKFSFIFSLLKAAYGELENCVIVGQFICSAAIIIPSCWKYFEEF